jgi:hypothetical protein
MSPGLVYNTAPADYIGFLFVLYMSNEVSIMVRKAVDYSDVKAIPERLLNYPSISVAFPTSWDPNTSMLVERTVKNDREAPTVYYPQFDFDGSAINVSVAPASLWFNDMNEIKTYTVSIPSPGMVACSWWCRALSGGCPKSTLSGAQSQPRSLDNIEIYLLDDLYCTVRVTE